MRLLPLLLALSFLPFPLYLDTQLLYYKSARLTTVVYPASSMKLALGILPQTVVHIYPTLNFFF